MAENSKKSKTGPKDKQYVNKNENYEVAYEKKHEQLAKRFGNIKKKS